MKGMICETEWLYPPNIDAIVKTFYRVPELGDDGKPLRYEDGVLPFHEVRALVDGKELRSMTRDALENLKSARAAEARKCLEKILEEEDV